jgi:hypothetical protein
MLVVAKAAPENKSVQHHGKAVAWQPCRASTSHRPSRAAREKRPSSGTTLRQAVEGFPSALALRRGRRHSRPRNECTTSPNLFLPTSPPHFSHLHKLRRAPDQQWKRRSTSRFETLETGIRSKVSVSVAVYLGFVCTPFVHEVSTGWASSGVFHTNLLRGNLETGFVSYRFQFPFSHG